MSAIRDFRNHPLGLTLSVFLASVLVSACEPDPAEIDEVPEVAEVEVDPVAVTIGPEGTTVVAEVRLEELFPLGTDDVGKVIMATGTVVGRVVPQGFFLRTEGSQVLFVRTTTPVTPGAAVRVVGPLGMATVAVFEDWEVDALEGEIQAEWDIQHRWYVDASSVTPVTRTSRIVP